MVKEFASRRRSIRIRGYDYTQPGAYFITICTRHRRPIFGKIVASSVHLNKKGRIALHEWWQTEILRPEVFLDQFVIMPNHIHAIIHLCQSDVGARRRRAPTHERFGAPVQGSLGTIIRAYKSMVTRRINRLREVKGVSIWQRNYYERVIRNNFELNQIRAYILQNPLQWEHDRYYIPHQARI